MRSLGRLEIVLGLKTIGAGIPAKKNHHSMIILY